METEFELVEKELIADYHFPKEEVLISKTDRKILAMEMERAITLGNLEHHKVKIYFADDKGKKVVNTTIWAITEKAVLLKKNVVLPKERIYKIEI